MTLDAGDDDPVRLWTLQAARRQSVAQKPPAGEPEQENAAPPWYLPHRAA